MIKKNSNVAKMWQDFATRKMEEPNFKPAYLQRPADKSLEKYWYVCFWIWSEAQNKLVRKRILTGGKTIEEREKSANEIIQEINRRLEAGAVADPVIKPTPTPVIGKNISVEGAIRHFLALKKKTMKERGYQTYESNANTFIEFLKINRLYTTPLRSFGAEQAHAYADWILLEKKLSNKSHNKHKGFASAIFNMYKRRKVIADNPFTEITKLTVTQGKHRVFSKAQISEFKHLCEENNDTGTWFFACWIYYTFMRPHQEARLIRIQDIGEKTIVVKETIAKTSRIRHVYIPPPLEVMLKEKNIRNYPPHFYLFSYNGKPGERVVGDDYWYSQHVRYMKKMGLFGQDYDLYGWKHTGVTALFRATKDLKLVQEQCGHSDIKQTVEYLRDLGVFYYEGQIEKFPPI